MKLISSLLVFALGFSVALHARGESGGRCESLFSPLLTRVQERTKADSDFVASALLQPPFARALREVFKHRSPSEIRDFILPMLKSADFRASLDQWLQAEFEQASKEIVKSNFEGVKDVIVGAGAHTLTLLLSQSSAKVSGTVVVERTSIGSTFHGKHFQLNSEQTGDLNRIPNALFQMSDITIDGRAPAADDFGFLMRLNYRAAGIRVLLGYRYDGVQVVRRTLRKPKVNVALSEMATGDRLMVSASRLGLAPGMDVRSQKHFSYVEREVEEACVRSELGGKMSETHGLATGAGFLKQVHRALLGDSSETFQGPRVAVVGAKHEGMTAVEGVLALIRAGRLPSNTKITVFGLKSNSVDAFAAEVTPKGGSDQFKAMIRRRYVDGGVASAISRGRVTGDPTHVTEIRLVNSSSAIEVKTEAGESFNFDMLIQTTGYDRAGGVWGTTRTNLLTDKNMKARDLKWPGAADPIGIGLYSHQLGGSTLVVYGFGVGASLPVSPERLKGAIGNPDALYVTLPYSELLGRMLDRSP